MIVSKPTARDLLFDNAAAFESRTALVDSTGEVSYKDLYRLVETFQEQLLECRVSRGDRIVLTGRNNAQLVAAILACWRLECLAIPIDFRMTVGEVANICQKVQASVVLASEVFADIQTLKTEILEKNGAKEQDTKFFTLESIVCSAAGSAAGSAKDSGAAGKSREPSSYDFDALVILTSGTTGTPKGAVHTFESLIENLRELSHYFRMGDTTRLILPLPVSHIFGLEVLFIVLLYGGTVILCDLDPTSMIGAINKYEPQILAGVPTIYGALLSAGKDRVNLEAAQLLLSGGAPLPISLARQFEETFGKRINNGYGSTESKLICLNVDGPLESIGRPIESATIRVIDPEGKELEEGQEGEIYIDCPLVMKGYLGQEEKTREALTPRGYRTGDIGYVKDGYVFISGRAKEMIIVAGNKVFPSEVEDVLARHPLVKEVAVTGVDHSRLGQIVKATIVIGDADLSEKLDGAQTKETRESILTDLKSFSKENLKRELRPMVWDLRPESQPLPKTRSGKIDKKMLS
ncbi:MAG: acyl--CoA ligase [Cyanobacteria bacterium HKST-UBA02]|nr:acyl--CoA ligase [Cyanobacteria bacterium HKST-UBA02]